MPSGSVLVPVADTQGNTSWATVPVTVAPTGFRVGVMMGMGQPEFDATADAVDATFLRLFQEGFARTAYVDRIRAEVARGRQVHFAGSSMDLNWWRSMANDLDDLPRGVVHAVPYHEPGIETFKTGTEAQYRTAMHNVIDAIGAQLPVSSCISSFSDRSGRFWVDSTLAAAIRGTGGAYDVDGYFRTLNGDKSYNPNTWGQLFDTSVARATWFGLDVYVTETGCLSSYDGFTVPQTQQVARINDARVWLASKPRVKSLCWWPLISGVNTDGHTRSYRIIDRPNSLAAWKGLA